MIAWAAKSATVTGESSTFCTRSLDCKMCWVSTHSSLASRTASQAARISSGNVRAAAAAERVRAKQRGLISGGGDGGGGGGSEAHLCLRLVLLVIVRVVRVDIHNPHRDVVVILVPPLVILRVQRDLVAAIAPMVMRVDVIVHPCLVTAAALPLTSTFPSGGFGS
mmetsp:Transcript_3065/g.7049  ORF Transcript_3065/g.7049 Transcript_3065/m.7049 type:complete len:165 (+) Transcript_3065:1977-2471(+)